MKEQTVTSPHRTLPPLHTSRPHPTLPQPQVDRGVPFSMGLTLKEQADDLASAETIRFEAKEKEIKKAAQEVRL